MATRILDTNIVSFIFNNHSFAGRYQPHLTGHLLVVSFMTVAELYEGARRANWGPARVGRLAALIRTMPMIPADLPLCHLWADIRVQRRRQPIGVADAWIAAVALARNADLVTHNPADFQGIAGLNIITEAP